MTSKVLPFHPFSVKLPDWNLLTHSASAPQKACTDPYCERWNVRGAGDPECFLVRIVTYAPSLRSHFITLIHFFHKCSRKHGHALPHIDLWVFIAHGSLAKTLVKQTRHFPHINISSVMWVSNLGTEELNGFLTCDLKHWQAHCYL